MSLDPEKRILQTPSRMQFCIEEIRKLGFEVFDVTDNSFYFLYNGKKVQMFPFTGWHTGKSIKDGRGINNLLKQLKN